MSSVTRKMFPTFISVFPCCTFSFTAHIESGLVLPATNSVRSLIWLSLNDLIHLLTYPIHLLTHLIHSSVSLTMLTQTGGHSPSERAYPRMCAGPHSEHRRNLQEGRWWISSWRKLSQHRIQRMFWNTSWHQVLRSHFCVRFLNTFWGLCNSANPN